MKERKFVIVTLSGQVPEPKVGDTYSDYGICGRAGFHSTVITEVTEDSIILKDDGLGGMKESKNVIPLSEYYQRMLMYSGEVKPNCYVCVEGDTCTAMEKVLRDDVEIVETSFIEIRDEDVQILINDDGTKIWVNTADGCKLRANKIPTLIINDDRKAT